MRLFAAIVLSIQVALTQGLGYGCFGLQSSPTECDCSAEVCSMASCTVRMLPIMRLRGICKPVILILARRPLFSFRRPKVAYGRIAAPNVNAAQNNTDVTI
jgi:hypothetical protein